MKATHKRKKGFICPFDRHSHDTLSPFDTFENFKRALHSRSSALAF